MSKQTIDHYFDELQEIYEQQGLMSLRDNGGNYDGINVYACPRANFQNARWNGEKNLWDILVLSDELKYFTGQLFLHRPLINNPTTEVDRETWPDKPSATYHQTLYDRRYCTYVSVCYEKAYNLWDRFGDLIHSFFPRLIPNITQVDFPRIIARIHETREVDVDFQWLYAAHQVEWQELNTYRRGVVHYYQYESNFQMDFLLGPPTDLQRMQHIYEEKYAKADYFRQHLQLTSQALAHTYRFLYRVAERSQ